MMKREIVVSNNINESEKLKSLASFSITTLNRKYMSTLELAKYLLEINGLTISKEFIKNDELAAAIYVDIKNIPYFHLFTYNDVLGIVSSIQDLRYQIIKDEEEIIKDKLPKDKFVTKNEAVYQAYLLIKKYLKDNSLIDEVGIIRYALDNVSTISDINFIRYEYSHLRPLEVALLDKAAGKEVKESKICEENKPLVIKRYTKAFGQTNEIEDIINYIYQNKIPFDQCLVVSAGGENYANIFNNYHEILNYPLTIGLGRNIVNTSAGRLFTLITDWKQSHYRHEYLSKIFKSEYFNLPLFKQDIELPEDLTELNSGLDYRYLIDMDYLVKIVGDLKINFFDDAKLNNKKIDNYVEVVTKNYEEKYNLEETASRYKSLGFVRKIAEIFNKGLESFLSRYSLLLDEKVDVAALDKISRILKFVDQYHIPYEDMEKEILSSNVSREKPQPGSLYFTTISKGVSCLRKHLFICGLSSNSFPGKRSEDPLLLDRDYEPFGVKDASNREINNNKDNYFALLDEAKKFGVNIYISWSIYNSESLKSLNSSSVVFETYIKEEGNKDKSIIDFDNEFKAGKDKYRYIEYFSNDLMPVNKIGKVLQDNQVIKYNPVPTSEPKDIEVKSLLTKSFSASMLTSYAKCQYLFYLQNVLKVEQDEDIDIYEIIPANDYGSLAHLLLEGLDNKTTSKEEFLKEAGKRFDEYIIMHPQDNKSMVNNAKQEFLKTMDNAYDMEKHEVAAFKEKDISIVHRPTGIRIHGYPDKVVDNGDKTYRIVDYKTGRKNKHSVSDVSSMIQCTLYSYIVEQRLHIKVTSFEYRYIRIHDQTRSNENGFTMADHYKNLEDTLNNLKSSISKGKFAPIEDKDTCKHCYYKGVCRHRKD